MKLKSIFLTLKLTAVLCVLSTSAFADNGEDNKATGKVVAATGKWAKLKNQDCEIKVLRADNSQFIADVNFGDSNQLSETVYASKKQRRGLEKLSYDYVLHTQPMREGNSRWIYTINYYIKNRNNELDVRREIYVQEIGGLSKYTDSSVRCKSN